MNHAINNTLKDAANMRFKSFRKSVVLLTIGALIGAAIILLIALGILSSQLTEFNLQNSESSQQISDLSKRLNLFESILVSQKASYQQQIDGIVTDMEADPSYVMECVKRYSYVLKKVDPNQGFTIGMLVYGDRLAKEHDINPDLIWEICTCEGHFDTHARMESTDARGMGGILPNIGKWVYEDLMGHPKGTYNHDMAYDGYVNLEMMVYIIEELQIEHDNDLNAMINHYSGDGTGSYYKNLISIAKADNVNVTRPTYN